MPFTINIQRNGNKNHNETPLPTQKNVDKDVEKLEASRIAGGKVKTGQPLWKKQFGCFLNKVIIKPSNS